MTSMAKKPREKPRDPKDSPYWSMPNRDRGRPKISTSVSMEAKQRLFELAEDVGVSQGLILDALILDPGAEERLVKKFGGG